jgi:hypothetical protein
MIYLYIGSFKEPGSGGSNRAGSEGGKGGIMGTQSTRRDNGIQVTAESLLKSIQAVQGRSVLIVGGKDDPIREKFVEYINRLQPSFKKFKKTKACKVLREKIYDAEQVTERVYG